MKDKLYKKFIEQINIEFLAFYKYLGMAMYFEAKNLNGLGAWFKEQADEEKEHAEKLIKHLIDLDKKVTLGAIKAVDTEYKSIEEVLSIALENEKFVSNCFRELFNLATAEKEYESITLIQWFIDEQVEEEKKFNDLILKLDQYKNELHAVRFDKFIKTLDLKQ